MGKILCKSKKFTVLLGWLICLILLSFHPMRAIKADEEKLPDGEYSVSLEMSGGSGKASINSPTLMKVENGEATAVITWSSANYDYMIVGGETYFNLSEEGMNSKFEIPILNWDSAMEVVADTIAMGDPVEVHYSLYFYRDSIGSTGELPQNAAMRVLIAAAAIIILGGILNSILKRRSNY